MYWLKRLLSKSYRDKKKEDQRISALMMERWSKPRVGPEPVYSWKVNTPPKQVSRGAIVSNKHTYKSSLEWKFDHSIKPSPAEKVIIELLNLYKIKWYREVSFTEFRSSNYGHYRFDFYLPEYNTIIEYDSAKFHNTPDRQVVDAIKTKWCSDNFISLIRYTNKHFYSLATHINSLMKELKVTRK